MALSIIAILFGGGILVLTVSSRAGMKIMGLFLIAGAMVAFSVSHKQGPPLRVYFPHLKKDFICIPTRIPKEKEILAHTDKRITSAGELFT